MVEERTKQKHPDNIEIAFAIRKSTLLNNGRYSEIATRLGS
jgi:hypothetical protein